MDLPVKHGDILLGKYRVERVVGHGGMGFVIAARHVELDELFALKVLRPEAAARPDAVERFLREARATVKLKGEHVVRVQDVGRLPSGAPYILMEYLEGTDLRALLHQKGPMSAKEASSYVLQACQTLREAHALGIVHRDVKPANLFLTRRSDGSPCIKVLDFGISKLPPGAAESLTGTTDVGGSPVYMSPEQMRSIKNVDHRTDVWSMGVVLYELLVGITPFHAQSVAGVAGRVLKDEPEAPSRLRPGIPSAIDGVVLRCLAKKPEDRYQSIEDFTAALQAALSGEKPFSWVTTVRMANPAQPGTGTLQLPVRLVSDSIGPAPRQVAPAAPGARSAPSPSPAQAPAALSPSVGVSTTTSGIGQSLRPLEARSKRGALIAMTAGALCIFIATVAMTLRREQGEAAASMPDVAASPAAETASASAPAAPDPAPSATPAAPGVPDPAPSAVPAAPDVPEPAPAASSSGSAAVRPPTPARTPPKKRTMH
jgi:serine/threonine protein kinase